MVMAMLFREVFAGVGPICRHWPTSTPALRCAVC